MTNYIFNEREYVESLIKNRTYAGQKFDSICRVAKYYHNEGYRRDDIARKLEAYMLRCEPDVNLVMWQDNIDRIIKNSGKRKLIDIPYITVTQSELDTINSIKSIMLRKLLFTMLCLAKYGNAINENNNNWVNTPDKEIFSMANIKVSTKRQSLLINDLWQMGYVGYSKVVDNINLNIKIIDDNSPEVLYITDFRCLGYQYMVSQGNDNYMVCTNCGLAMKRESNAQKYCEECGEEINRSRAQERYRSVLPS